MQFKKKTVNKEEIKNEPSAIPETVTDDDLSLSDDVSSFVSDEDLGASFVAPELEASDFETIEDDSAGWSSVDTELESKEDYYIDDTEYDSASYNSEIPMPEPPMLDDEEIVEHIVDDGEIVEENDEEKKATKEVAKENKNMTNKKMSLRDRLQAINEKNDSVLESIDKALVQAAEAQNCTSCVVTVDRVVTEGDFVMNYLNANGLDVINVEATGEESKLTISWE